MGIGQLTLLEEIVVRLLFVAGWSVRCDCARSMRKSWRHQHNNASASSAIKGSFVSRDGGSGSVAIFYVASFGLRLFEGDEEASESGERSARFLILAHVSQCYSLATRFALAAASCQPLDSGIRLRDIASLIFEETLSETEARPTAGNAAVMSE